MVHMKLKNATLKMTMFPSNLKASFGISVKLLTVLEMWFKDSCEHAKHIPILNRLPFRTKDNKVSVWSASVTK